MPGIVPIALFFSEKNFIDGHCINFTNELRGSLNLFGAGFLAPYFSQAVAATTTLFFYLVMIRVPKKSKRLLALLSLPLIYLIMLKLIDYSVVNLFSYCY